VVLVGMGMSVNVRRVGDRLSRVTAGWERGAGEPGAGWTSVSFIRR
jgi:hypothetical protein